MMLTESQAISVDFRTAAWGRPPYNGMTAYRPDFDHWLARKAEADGAELVCSTTATGLLRDGDRVVGVRTDRPDGDVTADVVIACDGVNSFLAKEAGLFDTVDAANYTLGVKETLALPKDVIDERFAVRGREGADIEILGGTSGVGGGVPLYQPRHARRRRGVEGAGAGGPVHPAGDDHRRLKAHPAIAPLVDGGELVEYSAHLIPEAGLSMIPKLATNGMVVAGDAASLCLAAGIWLEGVNFAMASGMYAGEAVDEALRASDVSAQGLAGYERRLASTFVLRDHRKLRRVPALVLSDRVQHEYPQLAANVVERMFRVDNPAPKPGLRRIVKEERKRAGIRLRHLARDAWAGVRGFG